MSGDRDEVFLCLLLPTLHFVQQDELTSHDNDDDTFNDEDIQASKDANQKEEMWKQQTEQP